MKLKSYKQATVAPNPDDDLETRLRKAIDANKFVMKKTSNIEDNWQRDFRKYLHSHPALEAKLGVDNKHVIVDMHDWKVAIDYQTNSRFY